MIKYRRPDLYVGEKIVRKKKVKDFLKGPQAAEAMLNSAQYQNLWLQKKVFRDKYDPEQYKGIKYMFAGRKDRLLDNIDYYTKELSSLEALKQTKQQELSKAKSENKKTKLQAEIAGISADINQNKANLDDAQKKLNEYKESSKGKAFKLVHRAVMNSDAITRKLERDFKKGKTKMNMTPAWFALLKNYTKVDDQLLEALSGRTYLKQLHKVEKEFTTEKDAIDDTDDDNKMDENNSKLTNQLSSIKYKQAPIRAQYLDKFGDQIDVYFKTKNKNKKL